MTIVKIQCYHDPCLEPEPEPMETDVGAARDDEVPNAPAITEEVTHGLRLACPTGCGH